MDQRHISNEMWSTTFHAEVPLVAFLGLVHFWIAPVFLVLGRTGCSNQGDDHRFQDGFGTRKIKLPRNLAFGTICSDT
jgi:hypothetical protein